MPQVPIELKGSNFTLSVIHVYNAKLETISLAIQNKIKQASKFLENAPIVINVASLSYKNNWPELYKAVSNTGLRVIGVSGCNDDKLKQEIIRSGLPLLTEGKISNYDILKKNKQNSLQFNTKTQLITKPVRSGQQIYARNSDLIIINNVSVGAEIIADGNIHVYGIMRGRALAGALGDSECRIFCTNFFPELVSISGKYWSNEQIPVEFLSKAVQLRLLKGILTIQPLLTL